MKVMNHQNQWYNLHLDATLLELNSAPEDMVYSQIWLVTEVTEILMTSDIWERIIRPNRLFCHYSLMQEIEMQLYVGQLCRHCLLTLSPIYPKMSYVLYKRHALQQYCSLLIRKWCFHLDNEICTTSTIGKQTTCVYCSVWRTSFLSFLSILQALAIDPGNTKALYRRAQAWQGIKDFDQALVIIKFVLVYVFKVFSKAFTFLIFI